MVIAFPKQVSKNCASCFEQCWSFIQSLSVEYSNTAIKTEDFEALEDSDGETGGVEGTITALLDFVTQLFEHKAFKKMVQQGLPPLLNSIMTFLQPSASQVETWRDDPDKFVEGEYKKNILQEMIRLDRSVTNITFCSSIYLKKNDRNDNYDSRQFNFAAK